MLLLLLLLLLQQQQLLLRIKCMPGNTQHSRCEGFMHNAQLRLKLLFHDPCMHTLAPHRVGVVLFTLMHHDEEASLLAILHHRVNIHYLQHKQHHES
jgi:hypothetical protein